MVAIGQRHDATEQLEGGAAARRIDALTDDWESLRARLGLGPYASAAWMEVYARFAPAARLVLTWRDGELAGALPLLEERGRIAGLPARMLRSLSDDHSQRFDALVADEDAAERLIEALDARRGWDALVLRDLAPDARANLIVDAARRRGWLVGDWKSIRSPYVPLTTVPELVGGLSSRFRANLRRRLARAREELGEVGLERVDAVPASLLGALEDGFRLEAAAWKGEAGTAIACDPQLRARYDALAFALARTGLLSLAFLTAGGRRVAFHYSVEENGVVYVLKCGYDPGYSRFGTGQLLVGAVAGELAARGGRELDLLGDEVPWKMDWTEHVRPHRWAYLFRPTRYGRALHVAKFRVAPAVRRILSSVERKP